MQEVVYDIVKKDTIYISIPFLEATDPDGALFAMTYGMTVVLL